MRNIIFIAVFGLVACATNPNTGSSSGDAKSDRGTDKISITSTDVANEFVSVMSGLDKFPPLSTTIQYSEPESEFAIEVIDALKKRGFGTQKVSADQGANYIEIDSSTAPFNKDVTKYIITIADITVQKSYINKDKSLSPVSVFEIQGTSPQYIEHDSKIEFYGENGVMLQHARESINGATDVDNDVYIPQKQLHVQFEPNSLDLGRDYKNTITNLADSFGDHNRFSVSTCLNGESQIGEGDEQAKQRGNRITQELLAHGIPPENIRTESCTIGGYSRTAEPFSVVLTLESGTNSTTVKRNTPDKQPPNEGKYYGFF